MNTSPVGQAAAENPLVHLYNKNNQERLPPSPTISKNRIPRRTFCSPKFRPFSITPPYRYHHFFSRTIRMIASRPQPPGKHEHNHGLRTHGYGREVSLRTAPPACPTMRPREASTDKGPRSIYDGTFSEGASSDLARRQRLATCFSAGLSTGLFSPAGRRPSATKTTA